MKSKLLTFMAAFLFCGELSAQADYPGFRCYIEPSGEGARVQSLATTSVTGTTNMAILLCVEKGQSTELDAQYFVAFLKDQIPKYFQNATFDNYHVNVIDVLVKDNDGVTAHAFELAGTLVPYPNPNNPPWNPDFVVGPDLVRDVLSQADAIYDFGNYDGDNDGIVDYLAFLVVRFAVGNQNGTAGLSIDSYYYTNDYKNGTQIRIDGTGYMTTAGKRAIIQRKKYPDRDGVLSMAAHELGHSLFSFPDVEHSGGIYFNHSSFGDFDPMSSGWGGFGNVASLYNPGFRVAKGWVTPIDASGTKTFSDFDASGQIFSYTLPSYSNAFSNQKYYFTYYTKDPNNRWQANWEVPRLSTGNNAGILVWRTIDGGSWSNRKAMPITLEAAHGKWIWNENTAPDRHAINTGQADILNGLDSLQERYSYIWQRYNSQTGTYENVLYQGNLYQVGSASCFFAPEHNKTFAFYTNPSNNEIASADQSRSITPGFAMKNLRWESGQTKADFVTGDVAYTITENTTLTAGTWYINNTVTVASGVTLTINPGAVLKFPSANIRIAVNGALNAAGTAANPVTIDFTAPYVYGMNGIQFNSGSSGSLAYCNIKNTNTGVLGSGSLSINNCTITNCNTGVSFTGLHAFNNNTVSNNQTGAVIGNTDIYSEICGNTITQNNSDGLVLYHVLSRSVSNNTITNNGGNGMYCYNGSQPYMWYNTISGNHLDGLHCESNSPAHCGSQYGDPGHNIFRQNTRCGVYANSSNVYLGATAEHYGLNSIYDNTQYGVSATSSSVIWAQYDWWGHQSPPNSVPGKVDTHTESGGGSFIRIRT